MIKTGKCVQNSNQRTGNCGHSTKGGVEAPNIWIFWRIVGARILGIAKKRYGSLLTGKVLETRRGKFYGEREQPGKDRDL